MAQGQDADPPVPLHLLATCSGHTNAVASVRFNPQGTLVASVSADCTLKLWRSADGEAAGPNSTANPHKAGINDVCWNSSGSYLATASDDLSAKIWDVETGKCLSTVQGHTNYVFCCQFNPNGQILATGSFDETIRFWCVRSGRCLRELPAHSDPVTAIDFNFDGTVLASCSFDGLLRLWDTHNGHCLKTLPIDNGSSPLSHVCFSPNGQYLLQASLNNKLQLVNFETGKVAKTYTGHQNSKFCSMMTFSTALNQRPSIAAGSEDGSIFVWDVNSKQVLQQLPGRSSKDDVGDGHCAAVLCVDGHPSQPLLASGGNLTKSLYDSKCVFKDPTTNVKGVEPYTKAVAALFDPSVSHADLISTDISGPDSISLRWRLEGKLKIGNLPIKPYTGTTVYTMNDSTGLIVRHDESWDISALDAFVSTLLPGLNFGAPPAPPVN
eukprot:gene10433-10591_t